MSQQPNSSLATVVESLEEVCAHFGFSRRSFFRWKNRGMPLLPDGRFDLVQIARWFGQQGKKKEKVPERDLQKEELARHARLKADLAELRFKKELGKLIPLAEVESIFALRSLAYRQGAIGFTRSLPPQLIKCQTEREMEAVLIKAVRELLENVLRLLPEKFRLGGDQPEIQDIVSPGAYENTISGGSGGEKK